MYEVIAAPLVAGATQLTVIASGANEVVGEAGVEGTVAARIEPAFDIVP